jgi:DNA-directed RNA polymerase subunit beta
MLAQNWLAARVLKSWVEDFVDEDTGEVVTIERNEVVLLIVRLLLKMSILIMIVDSGTKTVLLVHKEGHQYCRIMRLFIIHSKKTRVIQKKKLYCISIVNLRNAEPPDEATARDVIDKLFFSDKSVMILGRCWSLQD